MKPTPRLVVAVLASFLAGGVLPQAGLVTHDHAGGDTPHVHIGVVEPHGHDPARPHVHVDVGDGHAALALPHHVHTQHPFQLVDRAPGPALTPTLLAVATRPLPPPAPSDRTDPSARSRGPPPHVS